MLNSFKSNCYKCGETCDKGEGVLERVEKAHLKAWAGRLNPMPKLRSYIVKHSKCEALQSPDERWHHYKITKPIKE